MYIREQDLQSHLHEQLSSHLHEGLHEETAADNAISAAVEAKKAAQRDAKVKVMLELLVDEASFLIDAAVQKQAASMKPDDARIVKADAILRCVY